MESWASGGIASVAGITVEFLTVGKHNSLLPCIIILPHFSKASVLVSTKKKMLDTGVLQSVMTHLTFSEISRTKHLSCAPVCLQLFCDHIVNMYYLSVN